MSSSHGALDHGYDFPTMVGANSSDGGVFPTPAPKNYALSGKIMLSAIVILFSVVLLILCLHVYARWYLLRRSRLHRRSRRRRLVFAAENQANPPSGAATRGLDPEVIKSLPVFTYMGAECPAESDESMECAVCLSEFRPNEKGRRLPRCKHSFHLECIDMWFYSHITCPLCRSVVEPERCHPPPESVWIQIDAPAALELCESCRHEDGETAGVAPSMGCSSSSTSSTSAAPSYSRSDSARGAQLGRLEVPPRRGAEMLRGVEQEVAGSPGGVHGFKSPVSRRASLKRILSFDLRFYRGGCSSNEPDIEQGTTADAAEASTPRTSAPPPS